MGLVVLPSGAPTPWSPQGQLHADLTARVAVAPNTGTGTALTKSCRVVTLDQLDDGAGTWRLDLGPEQALILTHTDLCLDTFLAEGQLRTDDGPWPTLGFRRFRAGTEVFLLAESPATLWLKARPLPLWRHRPLRLDGPSFCVSSTSGLELCELSPARDARVVLLRFPPDSSIGWHEHERGEELVVVQGCLHDDQGIYPRGSWLRQPAGSGHEVHSPEGCMLYTHSGHLAR